MRVPSVLLRVVLVGVQKCCDAGLKRLKLNENGGYRKVGLRRQRRCWQQGRRTNQACWQVLRRDLIKLNLGSDMPSKDLTSENDKHKMRKSAK